MWQLSRQFNSFLDSSYSLASASQMRFSERCLSRLIMRAAPQDKRARLGGWVIDLSTPREELILGLQVSQRGLRCLVDSPISTICAQAHGFSYLEPRFSCRRLWPRHKGEGRHAAEANGMDPSPL